MPINIRIDGDVVILSNFGRLLNDPRYVDAVSDVRALLDQGHRQFILELGSLGEIGQAGLGLLTTITRTIRQGEGEAVLAKVHPRAERFFEEMRMDTYWNIFESVEDAKESFDRGRSS